MKKILIRMILLVLALTMVMGLSACSANRATADDTANGNGTDDANTTPSGDVSSDGDGSDKILFGMSSCLRVEYGTNVEKCFEQLCAQNENVECLGYLNGNGDATKHFEHIEAFKEKGADVIVMFTQDMSVTQEYVDAADGIPLIFMNNCPPQEVLDTGYAYFVGADESNSGYLGGQYAAEQLKAAGATEINYCVLMGSVGMETTVKRTEGFIKGLETAGLPLNEVFADYTEWDRESSIEKITPVLGTGKKIDVIGCNCGEIALGAIEALKAANMLDDVIVTSIDGMDAELTAIAAGELEITERVAPALTTENMFNMIIALANGETVDNYLVTQYTAITSENIGEYVS